MENKNYRNVKYLHLLSSNYLKNIVKIKNKNKEKKVYLKGL